MDLTTVTPSFVILGSPFSYSRATFRPPGPRVREAGCDTVSIPWMSGNRDSAPNLGRTDLKVGLNFYLTLFDGRFFAAALVLVDWRLLG